MGHDSNQCIHCFLLKPGRRFLEKNQVVRDLGIHKFWQTISEFPNNHNNCQHEPEEGTWGGIWTENGCY